MNISRFWASFRIVVRGHILNWFWRSRERRRAVRGMVKSNILEKYFLRYVSSVNSVQSENVCCDADEKIFSIWLQGEENAPDLVRACFRSVRRHCSQELVVLDEKTLFDYITLPDYIMDKRRRGMIGNAHFADICRVELLYRYGGFWLDATGFVTEPIPQWIIDSDFFVYLAGNVIPYSFMQNCFIRARRGAFLLAAWREMIFAYWKNENGAIDYFMHQLLFKTLVKNDERAKKYFEKMPQVNQDATHALWWRCRDLPFDIKKFNELTKGAFFQKTTYCKDVIDGSFADVMIKMGE